MKKFISILVIIGLFLSITISFGEERVKNINSKPRIRQDRKINKNQQEKRKEIKEERKKIREELGGYIKQGRENKAQTHKLVEQSKESYKEAKKHIQKLLKQKDSLTNEQIQSLKESLEILKDSSKKINNSKGDIRKITRELRTAKENGDHKKVKESYRKIIEIQNLRINNLKQVIKDFKRITEI